MKKATWAMLNETEKELLRSVESITQSDLDEDALVDLHDRVRRARNKYTTLYRRRAGAQVQKDAGRAAAHARHARTLVKAEAFEGALARVSTALAKAARASASALRSERLEAARRDAGQPEGRTRSTPRAKAARDTEARRAHRRTPVRKRASASARATTRRAEAKRDAR
jgi:hypothetical protein